VAARLGVPAEEVTLRVRTYRPGRRAVVHVRVGERGQGAAGFERYLKIVPPDELASLVGRMAALDGHVPVPEVVATWPDDGTIVLAALDGRTVREVLLSGDRAAVDELPDGGALVDLLDRLPAPAVGPTASVSRGPLARTAGHAGLLAVVMPRERERLEALVGRLGDPAGAGPVVTTHGDLHEAQLLVEGSRVVGVIDVDGAGPGRRVHDLAGLLSVTPFRAGGPRSTDGVAACSRRSSAPSTPSSSGERRPRRSWDWRRGRSGCRHRPGAARSAAGSRRPRPGRRWRVPEGGLADKGERAAKEQSA
jgi:hypothetical protein